MSDTTIVQPTIRLSRAWPAIGILHEDADLLALNKPAGLLAVPDRWDRDAEHLVGLLEAAIARGDDWVRQNDIRYLANAHRLDKFTSGVMLLAKTREALTHVVRQFRDRQSQKSYVALVHGCPSQETVEIDLPLAPHPRWPGRMMVNEKHGKPCRTVVHIQERFRQHTVLRVELHTGRLHQIRVHLQAISCPLVGDAVYGGGPLLLSQIKPTYKKKPGHEERPLMGRPALHAERLVVAQPTTGEDVTITAPWAKDLTVSVKYLRMFAVH